MGLELLVITIRVEKAFALRVQRHDLFPFGTDPRTFTVGDAYDRLIELLWRADRPVPPDSWERFRACVGDELSIEPSQISRTDRFRADLGAE